MRNNSLLFGYWKSKETEFDYVDVAAPFQFDSEDEALSHGEDNAQEYVLKSYSSGGHDFMRVKK